MHVEVVERVTGELRHLHLNLAALRVLPVLQRRHVHHAERRVGSHAEPARVLHVTGRHRREIVVLVEVSGERDEVEAERGVGLGVAEEENFRRVRVVLHESLHELGRGQGHREVRDGLPGPLRERVSVRHVTLVRIRVGVLLLGAVREEHGGDAFFGF